MSVKHSILAILASGPSFGYQLKKEFEELTVGIWPINDGQIYTTLARLQRDGLVEEIDEGEQKMVRLTDSGRSALDEWMGQTRPPATTDRDELTIASGSMPPHRSNDSPVSRPASRTAILARPPS